MISNPMNYTIRIKLAINLVLRPPKTLSLLAKIRQLELRELAKMLLGLNTFQQINGSYIRGSYFRDLNR